MSEQGLRGWGIMICVSLAIGVIVGALSMISHPEYSGRGWFGVGVLAILLAFMWESIKKIGCSHE